MLPAVLWSAAGMVSAVEVAERASWASAGYPGLDVVLLATCLALLLPAGLIMIAAGSSEESEAPAVAAVGIASLALGILVYALLGFGFQFGGLGLISDLKGAELLVSEWSPLDLAWGSGWGLIGLDGFFLHGAWMGQEEVVVVVVYNSVLAATALCIALLALARRFGFSVLMGLGLFFTLLIYPIYGNWLWGGGFLSRLGSTLGIGHGLIDFAGSGGVHALGALFALAAVVAFGPGRSNVGATSGLPPVRFPRMAVAGAFLALVGWFGVMLGNPLAGALVPYPQVLLNLLLAASAGALASSLYAWLVTGAPDLLMVTRGVVSALVTISASCPFISGWAALALGALAGLLLPLSIYVLETRLGLGASGSVMAVHGLPGLWGLVAVGLFADGRSGPGWNGVGAQQYLGVPGQGVSGLLTGAGLQPDWPG
ncbi:MAG: ammonium transporter, partial [Anaerolineae bacterium]|nr:ammonium transporter [Anaerolineae bacterium]